MNQTSTSQFGSLSVVIAENRTELGRIAGLQAAKLLSAAMRDQGQVRIILASAPSQNELLDSLLTQTVDWGCVTVFHMDEYIGLPADHPATFRQYQRSHVLSRITPAVFHGIAGESANAAAECERYSSLLREAPIDLVCLGIGENGHLAFNDPPVADFSDPAWVKQVELDELCRQQQVNDGCFPNLESVPKSALTLTIPALLSARAVVAAVPGPRKANAVRDCLKGPVSTACPASILREHPNATLYLDRESAALL